MPLGYTYPRTSSDTDKPVTEFKKHLAQTINTMADRAQQRIAIERGVVQGYRNIVEMLNNIIIEGE